MNLFEDNEVFIEFENRIITNFDASNRKNTEKYKIQLNGASKKFRHFFANLIWLYNYPIADKKRETKLSELKMYLNNSYNQDILENTVLEHGIASYGRLSQYIYYDINFLYFFTKQYIQNKTQNPHDIIENINLYDLMKDLTTEDFKNMKWLSSKHILHYLFNPDYYEPIVNTECKRKIVKYFLKKVSDNILDEDIYNIRKNIYGFDKSLYHICEDSAINRNNTKCLRKVARIIQKHITTNEYAITVEPKNDIDILSVEKTKIENGLKAEEIVHEEELTRVNKTVLINQIAKIYDIKEFGLLTQNIDNLMHYSKNFDTFAPFDLLSTRDEKLVYIEVKSTTSNEIYFSKSEIIFAYNHIDQYFVKVVSDNIVYDLDIQESFEQIYMEITDNTSLWTCETFKLKLEFL
ncbi:DUF3883 domain-containing protein [Sulfurimonas sp. NW15]|uniref:protein NO VEIN domain-containing protein n=1 Tax=Sulfurimonas sp. NW15 TaxID=2922729 RepID=UPI003DA9C32D